MEHSNSNSVSDSKSDPETMNTVNNNELFDDYNHNDNNDNNVLIDSMDHNPDLLEKVERVSTLELENLMLKKKLESTTSLLEQIQSKVVLDDEKPKKPKRFLKNKESYNFFQAHKNDQEIRKKARQMMIDDTAFVHWQYIKKITDIVFNEEQKSS